MASLVGGRRLLWSFVRRIARRVSRPVEHRLVRGIRVSLGVESEVEAFRMMTYESKEPETLDWIDEYVRPGDVFFDVGANIGVFTVYAALKGAEVFAFEPESQNFARLNENILLNGCSRAKAFCVGVAEAERLDTFFVREFVKGSAIHGLGAPVDAMGVEFDPAHRQGAVVVSLDHLVYKLGLPAPNHVKIDVDGGEELVVEGGRHVFRDPCLRSVLIETTGPEDMPEGLRHLEPVATTAPELVNREYPGVNHILIPKAARGRPVRGMRTGSE